MIVTQNISERFFWLMNYGERKWDVDLFIPIIFYVSFLMFLWFGLNAFREKNVE